MGTSNWFLDILLSIIIFFSVKEIIKNYIKTEVSKQLRDRLP